MISMIRFIVLVILAIPVSVNAAITFTDGKWESTFDCAEQTIINSINCDGLEISIEGAASDGSHSQIRAIDNNPLGIGNGYSQIDGYGDDGMGDGVNDSSEVIKATFPSPTKEFWARYYIKFPTNWRSTNFQWDKYFYVQSVGNTIQAILEPNSLGFRFVCQGDGSTTCQDTQVAYKVSDMLGGVTGDGLWHCIEIHVKMDTDNTDGISEAWVDGELIIQAQSVNYSKSITEARGGFTYFAMSLNQAYIVNVDNNMARVAIDDLVVYNTRPPNQDSYGNYFIGPIDTPANPVVEILTASGQTTAASVFTITGTATADTGQTISGVTCSGQTVTPDDGVWDEQSESFTCLANLALGENTLAFVGSDGTRTGSDSIVINRTSSIAKIINVTLQGTTVN